MFRCILVHFIHIPLNFPEVFGGHPKYSSFPHFVNLRVHGSRAKILLFIHSNHISHQHSFQSDVNSHLRLVLGQSYPLFYIQKEKLKIY